MARPEGYRKAARLMNMADHFNVPVIALVDTAGAYPGIGAEERGQAEAIARSTEACLEIGVPNVAVIIGEGGSGGAIAIATANRVIMLEHAIYSVDFAGGCGIDPVARHRQGPGRGLQHEDRRAGFGDGSASSTSSSRSRPAARIAIRRRRSPQPGTPSSGALGALRGSRSCDGDAVAPGEVSGDRPHARLIAAAAPDFGRNIA